ncbi:MAG: 50S ribosomal protein L9 [Chitinophagales bacterium]|nr:50S ribosomal protein L9 [Chitinophagales bacterium]
MEVILINDVDKLGFAEDIVKVKPGYARNFLIPRGLGVVKNPTNLAILAEKIKVREKNEAKQMANLNAILEQLKGTNLQIGAKVGTTSRIFGSVNAVQISEAFKKNGLEIDRRKITVKEGEIKELGSYTVVVNLTKEQSTEVPLEVIAE